MRRAKRRVPRIKCLWLAALVTGLACGAPAPVVQGQVVSVDKASHLMTVTDETNPSAPPLLIDIGTAEIGAQPEVGDQVRLVYRTVGEKKIALRVMDLTQQEKREKRGS